MAKDRKEKRQDFERKGKKNRDTVFSQISSETKKSATAVFLFGVSILFVLASIQKAGPVGDFLFRVFDKFLGIGYYLIPFIAVLVAVIFLATREKNFFGITFLGAGAFVFFGLGLIDVIFPDHGGYLGSFVGLLEIPFGKTAAIVLLSTFIIISILLAFDFQLSFKGLSILGEEEDEDENKTKKSLDLELKESLERELKKEKAEEVQEKKDAETKKTPEEVDPIIAEASNKINLNIKNAISKSKKYIAPPLSLLRTSTEKPTSGDLRLNANTIKRTLESFGIPVEMGEINIGPKVTRYTLKPAEGVKIAKITALNQDISLSLAAHPIRIEAPIPGKSLVGIEVPNKTAAIVRLGSLLSYKDFIDADPLVFPLGRDVTGEPIFANIEKMPHMMIAGSSGSGKSISIHSVLTSLLYKNSPDILKLILIDPKRVELAHYDGIPHLVAPVITDVKKSMGVFRWAIEEMDKRYEVLQRAGARDIKSYNSQPDKEKLPYILIVIDEMADLMSRYGKEVEGSIVRLAQMARATGIHLVLSTQRPSVDVVTGLIKANITTRLALKVGSQIDSKTILDTAGAEKLLGGGDMLLISSEYSKPKRIQGPYISEEEIVKVTKFIRENNNSQSEEAPEAQNLEKKLENVSGEKSEGKTGLMNPQSEMFDEYAGDDDEDELLREAVEIVKEAKKASASLLQRRLRVGYARAARLIDIMEEKGIVGPGEGAKPREILIIDDKAE